MSDSLTARRVAIVSMTISGVLAIIKITVGLLGGSTSTVADGFESASDVIASGVVLFGLIMASRPPDEDHPYGHGRLETLSGFTVGWLLAVIGLLIAFSSMRNHSETHPPPAAYTAWPLIASVLVKSALSLVKYQYAKKTRSAGLLADAYNDTVDILSGLVALTALGLTLYDPSRFLVADHYGGLGVGIIVVYLGLRVVRETTMQLMDTMPDAKEVVEIRRIALTVPGALGVEKCYARKTGLQYHVDLHLEVDPDLTVRASHDIASSVRDRIKAELDWVADVLVHVEPHGM
ncbi:MAG: cation transporter [Acidobacteria bacterium]|nr:cation transporter [Acidobacteriota bacterium]